MNQQRRTKRRIKKSGVIYFAVNNRIKNMVKIGMTTSTAESRLKTTNRKHEFMCGTWSITQKVKTNDVTRTEDLSHKIFSEYQDSESVSSEMYFVPDGWTVKQMADDVRDKDKIMRDQVDKETKAKEKVRTAQEELEKISEETDSLISLSNESE